MDEKAIKYFGFIFWVHLILVLFAYLSPFLFRLKIIIFAIILLFLQFSLVGGCILSKVQFNNAKDTTFLYPYLTMLGLELNPRKFKKFTGYILPLIVLFIAVVWQITLNKPPLIF